MSETTQDRRRYIHVTNIHSSSTWAALA